MTIETILTARPDLAQLLHSQDPTILRQARDSLRDQPELLLLFVNQVLTPLEHELGHEYLDWAGSRGIYSDKAIEASERRSQIVVLIDETRNLARPDPDRELDNLLDMYGIEVRTEDGQSIIVGPGAAKFAWKCKGSSRGDRHENEADLRQLLRTRLTNAEQRLHIVQTILFEGKVEFSTQLRCQHTDVITWELPKGQPETVHTEWLKRVGKPSVNRHCDSPMLTVRLYPAMLHQSAMDKKPSLLARILGR